MSVAPGMSEDEARALLEALLAKQEGTTTFYWENDETEEAVELIVDAMAKLIASNNRKLEADRRAEWQRSRLAH